MGHTKFQKHRFLDDETAHFWAFQTYEILKNKSFRCRKATA